MQYMDEILQNNDYVTGVNGQARWPVLMAPTSSLQRARSAIEHVADR
jgi:hypothetical protein